MSASSNDATALAPCTLHTRAVHDPSERAVSSGCGLDITATEFDGLLRQARRLDVMQQQLARRGLAR